MHSYGAYHYVPNVFLNLRFSSRSHLGIGSPISDYSVCFGLLFSFFYRLSRLEFGKNS